MTKEEIMKNAGEEHYRRPERLNVNEVRLNGSTGIFEKNYKDGDEWKRESLGTELEITILRLRRRLNDFNSQLRSSEHNSKNDNIILFGKNERIKGIASELREKYKGLRTENLAYSLLNGELIKVLIKGASLGSKDQSDERVSFYEYLNSFGKDEHVWEYKTILKTMKEKKGAQTYYTLHFVKGEKLSNLTIVGSSMEKLANSFTSEDSYYQNVDLKGDQKSKEIKSQNNNNIIESQEDIPSIQVDESLEDDIKPEDLPF